MYPRKFSLDKLAATQHTENHLLAPIFLLTILSKAETGIFVLDAVFLTSLMSRESAWNSDKAPQQQGVRSRDHGSPPIEA